MKARVAKPFALQITQRTAKLLALLPHDVRAEIAFGPLLIPLLAKLLRKVEHNGNGQAMVLAGKSYERLSRFRLHVCGINHRELACRQPLRRNEVQYLERLFSCRLIILIIGYKAPAKIGRKHLGRFELLPGKRRFSAARRADQNDQRKLRDGDNLRQYLFFQFDTL